MRQFRIRNRPCCLIQAAALRVFLGLSFAGAAAAQSSETELSIDSSRQRGGAHSVFTIPALEFRPKASQFPRERETGAAIDQFGSATSDVPGGQFVVANIQEANVQAAPILTLPGARPSISPQSSSENQTLSMLRLEELQTMAEATHPDVLRSQSLVSAARGAAAQAGRHANPNVGLDLQQLFSGGQAEQYGVAIDQRLINKDKRRLDKAVAIHEIQRRQQALETVRQHVSTNVRIAFIQVLRAQRQIDVARQLVAFNQDAVDLTKRLLAADEVPRTDVLGAQLELRTASLALSSAENRHVFAWKQLEESVNSPLNSAPLDGDLTAGQPKASYAAVLQQLRNQSPEVAQAMAQIEQARCFLARQRVEPRPDLSTSGLLNWRDNGIGGGVDAGIALSVPLPIWDKNEGAISEAFHQLQAANRRLEQLELNLATRLTPVYEQYLDAQHQVKTYRDDILPIAAETLSLVKQTYQVGEASFQSLLLAGRAHAENQIRYLDALERLRLAEARLDGLVIEIR